MKKLLLLIMAYFTANVFTFAGFTNVINSETTITASAPGNWGEVIENLKDDDVQTKYTCFFHSEEGVYIQYELTSATTLYKYSLSSSNDSPGRDGKTWFFLGSNDGIDWNILDERINEFFPGRFYTNEYVLRGNNTAYKYYRLFFTEIIGSDQLSFSEWKLFTENDSKVAPVTLKLTGTAVAESTDGIVLGWKGGYYELYTSLKSGTYSFEGDDILTGGTITTDDDAAVPYRIRVDYRTLPAEISVRMIEMVDLWTPWNKYTIDELYYAGNSVFKADNLLCSTEDWGDDRYRVRIFFEGDILETFGGWSSSSGHLTITHNSDWGTVDGINEWSLHISNRYKNTNLPFNIEVNFDPNSIYINTVTDYIPPTVPTSLSIQGTAIAESQGTPLPMKQDGVVFELYTALSSGTYSFEGDDDIGENTITVNGNNVPYRIRVNYATNPATITLQEIEIAYIWIAWSQDILAELVYQGNSVFKAEDIICDTREWSGEDSNDREDRHRVRIQFDNDVLETYAPKGDVNFALIGNGVWGPENDFNYSVNAKYKNTGIPFNIIVTLAASGDYMYSVEDYKTGIKIPQQTYATVYPTVFSDNLNIVVQKAGFSAEVLSISGQTVLSGSTNSEELTFSGMNMAKGIYLVKIMQDGHIISTSRVIKLQ